MSTTRCLVSRVETGATSSAACSLLLASESANAAKYCNCLKHTLSSQFVQPFGTTKLALFVQL